MRNYPATFDAYNSSPNKRRRFAIEIEFSASVSIWVVSHVDVVPTGATIVLRSVGSVSSVSHGLSRTSAVVSIGSLSFTCIDRDRTLTDELRTQLAAGRGVFGKTARLYIGDERMLWADYVLESTQIVESLNSSADGKYSFKCQDVQRQKRTNIFEAKIARLTVDITDSSTTIQVTDTTEFVGVEHGTSWSDSPSEIGVIYFKIEDEIISTLSIDKTANSFRNCVRGRLGTLAAAHTTDDDVGFNPESGLEVKEVVYLELPVPKMIYALETGVLLGQGGGSVLPEHWHAGISTDFINLASYTGIGDDLYNPDNDSDGTVFQFIDADSTDAKRFIERELLQITGLFQQIEADGTLSIRRRQPILAGAGRVRTLKAPEHLLSQPSMDFSGSDIVNNLRILWDYSRGEATRKTVITAADSISQWGEREQLTIEAQGLHGSLHSADVLIDLVSQTFDALAGPPIKVRARAHGSQSALEVGDVIGLEMPGRDFTGTGTTVVRSFEIQRISKDWTKNTIDLSLFGSSLDESVPLATVSNSTVIPDPWFDDTNTFVTGVDLGTLPEVTIDGNGDCVIDTDLTLTGSAVLGDNVWYCLANLIIDAGVTVTYTGNVEIRTLGTTQLNGDFDGVGGGLAGVADTYDYNTNIPFYPTITTPVDVPNFPTGALGGFGTTQPGGGILERMRQNSSGNTYYGTVQQIRGVNAVGTHNALPRFQAAYNGTQADLVGIPDDLRGTSGGPGVGRHFSDTRGTNKQETDLGGTGGDSGAGLMFVTRGFAFGASGKITTDGDDGSLGQYNAGFEAPAHGGGGAGGAPGAVLILVDGGLNPAPNTTENKMQAIYGSTPIPADGTFNYLPETLYENTTFRFGSGPRFPVDRLSGFASDSSGLDASFAAIRVQYVALQAGQPVQPITRTTLNYDDVDTSAITNTDGTYRFADGGVGTVTWADLTSGDVDSIEISENDLSSVDKSAFLDLIAVDDDIVWEDSDQRWVAWRITSVAEASGVYTFGLLLLGSNEADGSTDVVDKAISIKFSRADTSSFLTLIDNLAPEHRWDLDETSGTTAADSGSAGGLTLTQNGGVTFGATGLATNVPQTAFDFDGSNDYLTRTSVSITHAQGSIVMIFHPDASPLVDENTVLSYTNTGGATGVKIAARTNALPFVDGIWCNVSEATSISTSKGWRTNLDVTPSVGAHLLAIVQPADGSGVTFYLDGKKYARGHPLYEEVDNDGGDPNGWFSTVQASPLFPAHRIQLGSNFSTSAFKFFDGKQQNVFITDEVLTDAKYFELYAAIKDFLT